MILVDAVRGERTRHHDAMNKVFDEISRRLQASGGVKFNVIDYVPPHARLGLRDHILDYVTRELVYAPVVALRHTGGSILHIANQKLATLLHHLDIHPSVTICHDIIEHVREEYAQNRLWKRYIRRYIGGVLRSDIIVVPSEYTRQDILQHFGPPRDKIRVVHNGVDCSIYRPHEEAAFRFRRKYALPSNRRYMLYVGSEQPRKNFLTLVRAFTLLRKRFDDLVLLKFGRADELPRHPVRSQALSMLREAGLENEVIFFEELSETDLVGGYVLADVFIFPSLYEGFGLPPIESMACGTPVVTSGLTSLPEVVGDAARITDVREPNELADAISEVLTDRSLRETLIRKGLERASQFTWERSAHRMMEIYTELRARW